MKSSILNQIFWLDVEKQPSWNASVKECRVSLLFYILIFVYFYFDFHRVESINEFVTILK